MVKHMVMWSFKEEIPEEKKPELKAQIKEHLEGLVGVVPGLIKAEVVTDLLPSSTRDLCLITELESAEALAAYAVNPNHVHVADTYVRPNVCDRVCLRRCRYIVNEKSSGEALISSKIKSEARDQK